MSGVPGPAIRRRGRARLLALAVLPVAVVVGLMAWRLWQERASNASDGGPAGTGPPTAAAGDAGPPWTPGAVAAASRAALSVPPDAGPLPFGRGEKAAYRLTWRTGEGGGIFAGHATFSATVEREARHFVLDVETTGWVASLFEVRDRIETWTGADLLPSRQEQHLREGGRATDRTTRFDRSSQTFSVDDGNPAALPDGARDGVGALFYVRTLPLAAGYSARFPVVEGGRTYAVTLLVDRVERTGPVGQEVDAFRVASRLVLLPDRLETARAVVWVSADRRRVPLALDIETSFGSFRAELDTHESR